MPLHSSTFSPLLFLKKTKRNNTQFYVESALIVCIYRFLATSDSFKSLRPPITFRCVGILSFPNSINFGCMRFSFCLSIETKPI